MVEAASARRGAYWLCGIATVILLAYACLMAFNAPAGFPTSQATHSFWPWLGNKPVGEDGFYMLTVADNIATKHQIVYNYGRPATGIQPLATFVFAGLAWLVHLFHGSEWTIVRAMIVFGSALFCFFAWMMAKLVASLGPKQREPIVFTVAFFLTLCGYDLFRLFTYGLETGIYLCLILLCFWLTLRLSEAGKASWKDVIALGVAGGFAGLARIDFGILFAILLVFLLLRRILIPLQVVTCGLIALAITSPWFFFVHSVSGSWLPSSGHAEGRLISMRDLARFPRMAEAVLVNVFPWIYSHSPVPVLFLLGAVSVLLVAFLFTRSPETRAWLTSPGQYLKRISPWLAGGVSLVMVYIIFFAVPSFYVRYSSVIVIVTIPILAMLFAEQPAIIRRPALVVIPLAGFFMSYAFATLHRGYVGNNWLIDAGYIRQYYPNAHVGSFQSGTIGYFDRNVDNLDGKLNEAALKAGMAHHMPEYLDSDGINVLVEWPSYINETLPADYLAREWMPCPYPLPVPNAVCLVRKSAVRPDGSVTP